MSQEPGNHNQNGAAAAALGFIIACLIVTVLILAAEHSAHPPAVNADRAAVRAKALADLRVAESNALNSAGWKR